MIVKHGLTLAVSLALSTLATAAFADSATRPAGYQPHATAARVGEAGGNSVLVIKDVDPWNTTALDTNLANLGLGYDVIGSASISTTNLGNYCMVVIASDQPQSFYDTLQANLAQVNAFVQGGGVLEFHAADMGWQGATWAMAPGGVTHTQSYDAANLVANPASPIAAGIPSPFNGTWASHGALVNLPAGADVVTTDSAGAPTTAVYHVGAGTVVASETTLEYSNANGADFAAMLPNMLAYAHSQCRAISGKVTGLGLRALTCENSTTGQVVTGAIRGKAWSCTALGLSANPGDKVRVTLGGAAK